VNKKGGILLFKVVSKPQLVLSFLMVLIGFSQAFNNWGEKRGLSLFFLIASSVLLLFSIIGLFVYRKRQITLKTKELQRGSGL